jgi:NAD+ synthase
MNYKNLIDEIVKWLYEYCETAYMDGFVVGVSGGIDSAVTSALCASTGLKTIGVSMPIYQDLKPGTGAGRSAKHLGWLTDRFENAEYRWFDLSNVFEQMIKLFLTAGDLTLANMQSRLRMVTLYGVAQENKCLVCGTGNKVEDFGVGFFTKYGDGGVDISPIADCYKSDVYAMAKLMNIVPEIQEAKPTDGLWDDGRTDEDQLGATYDELEWAMKYKYNTDLTERQEQVLKIFMEHNARNRHKMESIPVYKRDV